jgi:hypothetical protein
MDYDEIQPETQDDADERSNAIWNVLRKVPGVNRIDSCRRTYDLGKWNITTSKEAYPAVTAWIDQHIVTLFNTLPDAIRTQSTYADFPVPRRLTKTPRSGASVSSTKTGTISVYNQELAARFASSSKITTVQRSAWRPHQPVEVISYAFDDSSFPPLANKHDSDTKSTASLSHFSNSLSEQTLKEAIAAETEKLRLETTARDSAMDARIQSIESRLTSLTTAIVADIFKHMSGEGSPFVTKTILEAKLDQQFALIERLSQQIEKIATAVSTTPPNTIASPPRKLPRCTGPSPLNSEDHPMNEIHENHENNDHPMLETDEQKCE